ncbi:hypothetical protein [Cystobacter ferrugineus]|uniref:Uncharacterized protein n=1 Tax=Cystobacter ferrugineus TaxID=83449 RepID=A0A1L9B3P8_9BACT|nr:hypothetical protein [Cystobacter ferrugineus]OJH36882.1 hypothetical protein BON30_30780 [Cystobacter ferrugineus]
MRPALLLMLCLLPLRVLGNPPLPGDDSIRARLKACLLAGDMACVVDQYLALQDIGRVPGWLVSFQNAFALTNRKAGECERVARTVHEGLVKLGERPEFIRFSVSGPSRVRVLGFDETTQGVVVKTHQVSTTGVHVTIRLGNKIIDAYTGLTGLPFQDYVARLRTSPGNRIVDEVLKEL